MTFIVGSFRGAPGGAGGFGQATSDLGEDRHGRAILLLTSDRERNHAVGTVRWINPGVMASSHSRRRAKSRPSPSAR
jgi:hypothetical protein